MQLPVFIRAQVVQRFGFLTGTIDYTLVLWLTLGCISSKYSPFHFPLQQVGYEWTRIWDGTAKTAGPN